jgi:hypothetical protein
MRFKEYLDEVINVSPATMNISEPALSDRKVTYADRFRQLLRTRGSPRTNPIQTTPMFRGEFGTQPTDDMT